ncbi:hypothetical protein DMUE_3911 [Dictyocoela muelleri]|nr:hypothetical protein DMUE_3911 [Dictyocoela muelleri]
MKIDINKKLKNNAISTNVDFRDSLNKAIIDKRRDELKNIRKYDSMRDYFIRLRNNYKYSENKDSIGILESLKYAFDNLLFLQSSNLNEKDGFLFFSQEKFRLF